MKKVEMKISTRLKVYSAWSVLFVCFCCGIICSIKGGSRRQKTNQRCAKYSDFSRDQKLNDEVTRLLDAGYLEASVE